MKVKIVGMDTVYGWWSLSRASTAFDRTARTRTYHYCVWQAALALMVVWFIINSSCLEGSHGRENGGTAPSPRVHDGKINEWLNHRLSFGILMEWSSFGACYTLSYVYFLFTVLFILSHEIVWFLSFLGTRRTDARWMMGNHFVSSACVCVCVWLGYLLIQPIGTLGACWSESFM